MIGGPRAPESPRPAGNERHLAVSRFRSLTGEDAPRFFPLGWHRTPTAFRVHGLNSRNWWALWFRTYDLRLVRAR